MHAEGVEVHPLVQPTGEAEFNEVELHDVFVPDDQLVGDEGDGWRVAGSTLSHERGVNPRQLVIHMQLLEELLRLARDNGGFDDCRLRRSWPRRYRGPPVPAAQLALAVRAVQGRGTRPGGEHPQAVLERDVQAPPQTALDVLGPASPLWDGAPGNPGDGAWQRAWLYYQASSIFAGTNEIQRTVVGERVLGLPRG